MKRLVGIVSSVLAAIPVQALAADFDLDPAHSGVGFSVKHLVVSNVKGQFDKVTGTVSFDPKKVDATVIDVTIDTTSIDTRDAKRDGHLKSADFFDVEKFPTATFKSKKVESAGKGKLKVTGELTIKGVTKAFTLDVTGPSPEVKTPFGTTILAASATGVVKRKDFGITWNKTLDGGGVMVGEDIALTIDVELVKKEAAKEAK
jgi:polyisoprenoid-binding protein YceI